MNLRPAQLSRALRGVRDPTPHQPTAEHRRFVRRFGELHADLARLSSLVALGLTSSYNPMMSEAIAYRFLSVDDYLAAERQSEVKHDYVDGQVFAMAGGKVAHNRIATNVLGALHGQLRGKPCRPFNSDMKVRIQLPTHTRFYYPDVSVICESNPEDDEFQDRPRVLIEVLSDSTRRTDQTEKKDAYLTIPSLDAYIMLEVETPAAIVYRRTDAGFVREIHEGAEAVISLDTTGATLPLAEVYGD